MRLWCPLPLPLVGAWGIPIAIGGVWGIPTASDWGGMPIAICIAGGGMPIAIGGGMPNDEIIR